ncbi:MAG: thiamine-phosphate kinase [Actinomycetota bacterium]
MTVVSELGESALIERIAARLGAPGADELWSGDDAAVLRPPGGSLLFTTDVVVEGVDFDMTWSSAPDVGWKALAVNASDIAAMGGRPAYAVAGLSLPRHTDVDVVDGIVDGMLAAARRWDIAVVGGDISEATELSLAIAMLGAPVEAAAVTRAGAALGDALCVTGALGGAAGGLVALRHGLVEGSGAAALHRLAARQLRPTARVEEGVALARVGASSMIDVSDGLAVDLARLVAAGGTGCRVDLDALPVDDDLGALGGMWPVDELELAIAGGEDFELLVALDPRRVDEARAALAGAGTTLTQIGVVVEHERRMGDTELEAWRERGWEHLQKR